MSVTSNSLALRPTQHTKSIPATSLFYVCSACIPAMISQSLISIGHCGGRLRACRRNVLASVATPTQTSIQYRTLGRSDLKVSDVCLGTMTFGQQVEEAQAQSLMSYATDMGINFFDSSELYPVPPQKETQGRTSEYIGRWMKEAGKKREDLVLATKLVGNAQGVGPTLGWVTASRTVPAGKEVPPKVDPENIRSAVEGELRRLQTDYIDLIQIHWADRYSPFFGRSRYFPEKEWDSVPFEVQVEAVGKLIDEGKIRHWGLSNETTYGAVMMCHAADQLGVPRPISIQNSYSLVDRGFENSLAETCSPRNLGLALLPWSAAGGGALSGKYLNSTQPEGSRLTLFGERYRRFLSRRCQAAVEDYVKIAKEVNVTPMQLAYLFCRSKWFVGSVMIGVTTMEQLKQNIAGFASELPQEALDAIDAVHSMIPNPQNED